METVFKSAVFFVLFFTETIAPLCPDFEIMPSSDPDTWNDDPRWDIDRDFKTHYCVWTSWASWGGCFRGKKSRYRLKGDELSHCRCDIEFQTQSCQIVGKFPKICVFIPVGQPRAHLS